MVLRIATAIVNYYVVVFLVRQGPLGKDKGKQQQFTVAKALAIYRIEKPRNPENRRKTGKILENPIFCLFLVYFSYFLPIFCLFFAYFLPIF